MEQQGEYTSFSLDLQGDINGIDCCLGTSVYLQLCSDGVTLYQTLGPVDALGVELLVSCAEHGDHPGPVRPELIVDRDEVKRQLRGDRL